MQGCKGCKGARVQGCKWPFSRNTPVVFRNTPVVFRNTPALFRNTPVVFRNTPVVFRNTPVVLPFAVDFTGFTPLMHPRHPLLHPCYTLLSGCKGGMILIFSRLHSVLTPLHPFSRKLARARAKRTNRLLFYMMYPLRRIYILFTAHGCKSA